MKKTIFGIFSIAIAVSTLQFAQAGLFDQCTPCAKIADCNPCDNADYCAPQSGQWFLNGHIEAGFFANGHGQKSRYTGGATERGRGADDNSGNTCLLENTRLTGGQINQVYLSMGRSVNGKRGWDIGGTVDVTWGSDAYITQARGMEYGAGHGSAADEGRWGKGDYYAAFAQAYAELAYKRWNIKAGKFYALFGSADYKSTDRFFYSLDQGCAFMPHVASGAYVTYMVNDQLSVSSGWVVPGEFGESSKYNAVFGGLDWEPTERLNLRYAFAAGRNTYDNDYGGSYNVFIHSLGATYQIGRKWEYGLEWSLLNLNVDAVGEKKYNAAYALNNEIIYQYNKNWALGVRFGILDNNAGDAVNDLDLPTGEWYMVSLGANWTPNKWLLVKPEVRYDWIKDAAARPFNLERSSYQISGGMSAVVKF